MHNSNHITNIVEQCRHLISKTNHSETRVPYTYHHDMIRLHVYHDKSRAEVAMENPSVSDEELYLFSLFYILEGTNVLEGIEIFSEEDLKNILSLEKDFHLYRSLYKNWK